MIVEAAVLGASAAASPGPFQAVLLQRAVRAGPWRALPLAAVPLVSDPVVIVACLVMLSGMPPGLVRLLQLGGGVLLCWMGAGALRDLLRGGAATGALAPVPATALVQAPTPLSASAPVPASAPARAAAREQAPAPDRGFAQAALVNLLNPNAWMFWSLVGGPLLAGALRRGPAEGGLFLLAFYLPLTATNAALVAFFGAVGRLGPRAARLLGGASAAAFLGLGLLQLWRGVVG